ncbi:hypothetical protein GN956_G10411 [Arapaima gigas]
MCPAEGAFRGAEVRGELGAGLRKWSLCLLQTICMDTSRGCRTGATYHSSEAHEPQRERLCTLLNRFKPIMILWVLLSAALSVDYSAAVLDEEKKVVCSGKDFTLPIQSRLRIVVFSPMFSPESTKVVLENNKIMDPRYEWTGDKTLLLRGVTKRDQGLFKVKMSSGIIYRKIHLTVVGKRLLLTVLFYGDDFKIDISHGGAVIEFSPKGSQAFPQSIILWNSSVPWESQRGRGSVKDGHWVLEEVTQSDQGNYNLRDGSGQLLSAIHLNVEGRYFSFTYFTGESLILPLFLPFAKAHLSFIPSSTSVHSSSHHATILLVRDGQVVTKDARYKGQLTLAQVDDANEIVIAQLRLEDSGVYEIQDREGNLVSSTWLEVVKKPKWKVNFKSIAAPLSGFGFVALIIYFKKKYPSCNLKNRNAQRNPNTTSFNPHVYSEANSYPHTPSLPGQPQWSGAPANWSSGSINAGYTPVVSGVYGPSATTETEEESGGRSETTTTSLISHTEGLERERKISVPLPLNSDCLHSSEACAQFQIEKNEKEPGNEGKEYFSSLPLNTDTSQSCSVYTSDKLSFL